MVPLNLRRKHGQLRSTLYVDRVLRERSYQIPQALPVVAEVRQRGFMVGIELAEQPPEARLGHQVTLAARRRGAIIRPLGDVVVLMPPLSISEADLGRLIAITASAISEATSGRLRAAA